MLSALLASYSFLASVGHAPVQETAVSDEVPGYGIETTFSSRYVFRGIPMSPGPVSHSSASITVAGLALYAWGNVMLGGSTQQPRLSEMDFGISYARSWKSLSLEPALDGYLYRYRAGAATTAPSTAEVSLEVSRAVGPTRVFTRQIVDVAAYRGAYYGEAGISRDQALSRSAVLAAALSVGWGSAAYNRAFGVPHPALNVLTFEASLARASLRRLSVEPQVEISYLCDGRLRRRVASGLLVSFGAAAKLGR